MEKEELRFPLDNFIDTRALSDLQCLIAPLCTRRLEERFVYLLSSTYSETLQLWARIKSVEKEKFSHAPLIHYLEALGALS